MWTRWRLPRELHVQSRGSKHALVVVLNSKVLKQGCGLIREALLQRLLHQESWRGLGMRVTHIPRGGCQAGRQALPGEDGCE